MQHEWANLSSSNVYSFESLEATLLHRGTMKFQARLLAYLVPAIVVSSLCSFFLLERETAQTVFDGYRAKLLTVASAGAAMVDAVEHARLVSRGDESKPEYSKIQNDLRRLRNLNRRDDTWIANLYTVYYAAAEPGILRYGIDTEDAPENFSNFADVVHTEQLKGIDLSKPYALEDFARDSFGTWLIATHPVLDDAGHAVAAVVAEIRSSRVTAVTSNLYQHAATIAGIEVLLLTLCSMLIARRVTVPLKQLCSAMGEVAKGNFDVDSGVHLDDEIGEAATALHSMAHDLKEREHIKLAFARYVSHQVAEIVLKHPTSQANALVGQRRRITVLFADVRGFTSISERLPPEEVVSLLNEYFERMVEAIFKHGGTLDKFLGDGLMAIFGSPLEDSYQEENALAAALEMLSAASDLSHRITEKYGQTFRIGIGINSGTAVVGNIGSSKRMEYTAIGDTVNLASRLESQTKELGVDILFSDYTRTGLHGELAQRLRRIGGVKVRGRAQEVIAWTIENASDSVQADQNLADTDELPHMH
jgi:adenylate cyclase